MAKNELLASWTYREGELVQQRILQKAPLMAVSIGLGLLAAILLPLFVWQGQLFAKAAGWALVLSLLALAWLLYHRFALFCRLLFAAYRFFVPPKAEEAIITTAKVITERKTWILHDERRELTAITLDTRGQRAQLIFTGKEKGRGRPFELSLPVPVGQLALAYTVYSHFMEQLALAGG